MDDVLGPIVKRASIDTYHLVGPVELPRQEPAETPTHTGDQHGSLGGGLGKLSRDRRRLADLLRWPG
jgi:hypothetical protein